MSNIDEFIDYLDQNNRPEINPHALTVNELAVIARHMGFAINTKSIQSKIEKINNTPPEDLSAVEKKWRDDR